jgi:hypothetical protein
VPALRVLTSIYVDDPNPRCAALPQHQRQHQLLAATTKKSNQFVPKLAVSLQFWVMGAGRAISHAFTNGSPEGAVASAQNPAAERQNIRVLAAQHAVGGPM